MGYDQVVNRRGTVIPKRDLERETDRYSTEWQVTRKTPEEVQAYLRETYGDKLAQRPMRTPPRYSDQCNFQTYMRQKAKGLSDQAIADMYGINRSTLAMRKKRWIWNKQHS